MQVSKLGIDANGRNVVGVHGSEVEAIEVAIACALMSHESEAYRSIFVFKRGDIFVLQRSISDLVGRTIRVQASGLIEVLEVE